MGIETAAVICTPSRVLTPKTPAITYPDRDAPPEYITTQERSVVISSSRGKVTAIDEENGETLWKYDCPGGGYNVPVAVVEPPSAENGLPHQVVYVGCGQWVYCLRALTGTLIWSHKITAAKISMGYIVIATPWSSRVAAETHTAFAHIPVAQQRSEED